MAGRVAITTTAGLGVELGGRRVSTINQAAGEGPLGIAELGRERPRESKEDAGIRARNNQHQGPRASRPAGCTAELREARAERESPLGCVQTLPAAAVRVRRKQQSWD